MKRLRTALRRQTDDRPNSLLIGWIPRRCFSCRHVYVPLRHGEGVVRVRAHTPAYADHRIHGHPGCCAREVLT